MPRITSSRDKQRKAQIDIFKRFVETSGQGLGMADLEGRIFFANATLCRLLGEESAETLYQTDVFAFYGSETALRLREEILPTVLREGQWVGELTVIDSRGQAIPTIENIFLLRDDTGRALYIANVITDISQIKRMEQEIRTYRDHLEDLVSERTAELERSNALLQKEIAERKQAEEAARVGEERFRRLAENAKDMIFRMRLSDGCYEYVSPAALDITGYEPEEFYRNPRLIQRVIHPDWSDFLGREFENIMKGAMSPAYEFKFIHKSGQERWAHQRNVLVKDEQGRPLAIEGIVTDVTARKHAETALAESEARIREMIDNAPFGAHSYQLEDDGALIFLGGNPAADHILNIEHAALIGKTIEDAFPMLAPEILQGYREVARTGQRWVKDVIQYKDRAIAGAFTVFAFQTGPNRMTAFFYDITERKRVEQERTRLMAILESTSDLVATSRPDGGLLYLNAAGRRMLGWGADDDIRGHNLNDAHPAWALRVVHGEGIPEARAHGIWHGETAVLNREGGEIPVSQVIMAHTGESGDIDYISTIMRDISERKRSEQELKGRAQQLQRQNEVLFSLIADGEIFRGDFLQAVTLVTRAGSDLLNTERVSVWLYDESYSTMQCVDLYEHGPDRHSAGEILIAADFPAYTSAHRQGKVIAAEDVSTDARTREIPAVYFQEHAIRALIDAPIWLENRIGGVLSFEHMHSTRTWTPEDERLATIMGTIISLCYEITMRRRTESVLRESEEKFRTIFESAPMSIAISDLEGLFIDVNAQMCEKAHLSREAILGRRFGELQQLARPEDPAEALRLREKLLAQGWLSNEEVHLCRPSTNEHMINLLSARLVAIAGKPYVISMLLDITERKRLEEQFLQAQKMESIGRLAGGVAHDFNNLLTAILGNTELALLEKDVGPRASMRLQAVQQAAASAADLTKQLLAFSRKQIIEPTVIDLNELIWNMGKMLARVIGEDVTLRSTSQPGLHPIRVDAGQIRQIIMNLAVNARDAMPDGGLLTIETADVVLDDEYCRRHGYGMPGPHVMLAVSDTGTGMSAEVKEHLFEPFYTTKAQGKGTGLGLATVYGAVKQNNGYIDVYSEPGQGTCFKIYFPAVAIEELPDMKVSGAEELPGGSETVLLVEDDPGVLEFASGTLELLGYRVLTARDGEEAVALAGEYHDTIDLLMTDVKLPGMNGRQLADILVRDRPGLKILFNSGYTQDTIVHHGVLERDLHFIGKPYSAQALAHKLRQVLDGT